MSNDIPKPLRSTATTIVRARIAEKRCLKLDEPGEEILSWVEPLRSPQLLNQNQEYSQDLRNLAHQALTSLRNRYNETVREWAEGIASNVADAID